MTVDIPDCRVFFCKLKYFDITDCIKFLFWIITKPTEMNIVTFLTYTTKIQYPIHRVSLHARNAFLFSFLGQYCLYHLMILYYALIGIHRYTRKGSDCVDHTTQSDTN